MTQEEINALLIEAVARYSTLTSAPAVKSIAKKLQTCSDFQIVALSVPDAYQSAKDAMKACGEILLEDDNNQHIEGLIYAGAASMNPAIVVVVASGAALSIGAFAKEGLINQHTAKKAIELYIHAL